MTDRFRRSLVAPLAALALVPAAAPAGAQTPSIDELIAAIRAAIDFLDDFAVRPPCDQVAEPARWESVGVPDSGAARPVISAHRGALTLAPENTLHSYEYAFAFGVDLVEVDVQQTRDGRFVAMHDSTVDRTTDGTGNVADFTFDEIRALNAADYPPWAGGEFDPAQVASLEEVLALAARVGRGLELDIKESVTEEGQLADLVASHGLIEESIFNSGDVRILVAQPGARIIYNRDAWEPAFLFYEIGQVAAVFGSRLDEYTAESIAAAHDACGLVMPHAYDAGPDAEVDQFLAARAIGADGVQTNQPELIVAAAGLRVKSRIVTRLAGDGAIEVCLVDADHELGFPTKTVQLRKGRHRIDLTAGKGGCAPLPGHRWLGATARFAGDGAVEASSARVRRPSCGR